MLYIVGSQEDVEGPLTNKCCIAKLRKRQVFIWSQNNCMLRREWPRILFANLQHKIKQGASEWADE